MATNFLSTLGQNKPLGALTLTFFVATMLITPLAFLYYFQDNQGNKNKVAIRPELNINDELIKCLKNEDVLTISISKPQPSQEFQENDDINFEGSATFKCADLAQDIVKTEYAHQWFLNSDNNPISKDTKGSLGKKSAGDYVLKYNVTLKVKGIQDFEKQAETSFKVVSPPEQIQPTPPVPQPQQPPPNNTPNAQIITPKEGSIYYANQFNPASGTYYATVSRIQGRGSDPEDGTLSGASLQWYYQSPTSGRVFFGNGAGPLSIKLYPPVCYENLYKIILVATDSKGASSEAIVNIVVNNSCLI